MLWQARLISSQPVHEHMIFKTLLLQRSWQSAQERARLLSGFTSDLVLLVRSGCPVLGLRQEHMEHEGILLAGRLWRQGGQRARQKIQGWSWPSLHNKELCAFVQLECHVNCCKRCLPGAVQYQRLAACSATP